MKTHKKCKGCGISKPIYRFTNNGICFACRQKAELKKLEKELFKPSPANDDKAMIASDPICLYCKQPMLTGQKRAGAYHYKCRAKKNAEVS